MKQLIVLAMTVCLLMTATADRPEIISLFGEEGEDIPMYFQAEDGLTVLSCHVILDIGPGSWNCLLLYAEVRNDGDVPVEPECIVYISDDTDEEPYYWYLGDCAPNIVLPGQTAYIYDTVELLYYCEERGWDDVDKRSLRDICVRFDDYIWIEIPEEPEAAPSVTAVVEEIDAPEEPSWVWQALRVTITNDSDEALVNPGIAVGAYDAQGRLLYGPWTTWFNGFGNDERLIVPAGGSLVADLYVHEEDGAFMDACGLEAVEYRCLVY